MLTPARAGPAVVSFNPSAALTAACFSTDSIDKVPTAPTDMSAQARWITKANMIARTIAGSVLIVPL
jgi:hypothetical protein